MDYGRSVLLMTAEQSHGVTGGEPDVQPRGGIFGPHGGGGGIYDGTNALNGVEGVGMGQAGLGWYFAAETPHQMRHAINPAEGAHGVGGGGLGVIPANCWGVPEFEDCKAVRWDLARKECDPSYGGSYAPYSSVGACIDDKAGQYAEAECVRFCPGAGTSKSGGSWSYTKGAPCGATNTIKFVQAWLDVTADGIWGTNSQKALTSSGKKYTDIAESCTGAVPGTGGGGYAPPPKKDVPVNPVVASHHGNLNALWIAIGVTALGAGAFMLAKKKPMRSNRRRRRAA